MKKNITNLDQSYANQPTICFWPPAFALTDCNVNQSVNKFVSAPSFFIVFIANVWMFAFINQSIINK